VPWRDAPERALAPRSTRPERSPIMVDRGPVPGTGRSDKPRCPVARNHRDDDGRACRRTRRSAARSGALPGCARTANLAVSRLGSVYSGGRADRQGRPFRGVLAPSMDPARSVPPAAVRPSSPRGSAGLGAASRRSRGTVRRRSVGDTDLLLWLGYLKSQRRILACRGEIAPERAIWRV
jgi:hypothetical protein